MDRVLILNGSPRAPKSNSKRYAEIFSGKFSGQTEYFNISKKNHREICSKLDGVSDVMFVFPLYVDGIPVTLLQFLKTLERNPPRSKPVVSVLINCGFLEDWQTDVAIKMMALFCRQNGYRLGSVLKIGGGEAILDTPFRMLAVRKIKQMAVSIAKAKYRTLHTIMPLSPNMFTKASTSYWIRYGKKNGITKEQMQTMRIE